LGATAWARASIDTGKACRAVGLPRAGSSLLTRLGAPTVPEVAGTTRGHAMNGLALGSAIPDADGDDAGRQYNGRPIGPTASRA
jgi:hypothetical protein